MDFYLNYDLFSPILSLKNSESDPIRGFPGIHLETPLLLLPSAACSSQRRPRVHRSRPRAAAHLPAPPARRARPRDCPGRRARLQRRLRGRPGCRPPCWRREGSERESEREKERESVSGIKERERERVWVSFSVKEREEGEVANYLGKDF